MTFPARRTPTAADRQNLIAEARRDFPIFAKSCLQIKDKAGKIVPLVLNEAQRYAHDRIEDQLRCKGWVRAILLKGRQQGLSTYVEGRFYYKTSGSFGKSAYVLAHEAKASDNLFNMARRYHDNCPAVVRPHTGKSNAKELFFDVLDSGYLVATAGSKATGRSATVQYFHGSETAYWDDAEAHMAGIGQTVPDLPGTEIILESTANGIGNMFHNAWTQAERGRSDFIPIFIPWFWQTEYRCPVGADFDLEASDDEDESSEADLVEVYGLDHAQIAWRRKKIATDFSGDSALFRQEYPCTPIEAFMASGGKGLIRPKLVMAARKCEIKDPYGALVVGVDPARFGVDSTSISWRRGRKQTKKLRLHGLDTMEVAGRVAMIIRDDDPDMTFIDVGGLGAGVVDRLRELDFGDRITAVNFGERSIMPEKYVNMRAQMWGEMRDWLADRPCDILDDDVQHGDLVAPRSSYDSKQRLKLESKESMMNRGLPSPDDGDGLALTFAYPVAPRRGVQAEESWRQRLKKMQQARGSDMAL